MLRINRDEVARIEFDDTTARAISTAASVVARDAASVAAQDVPPACASAPSMSSPTRRGPIRASTCGPGQTIAFEATGEVTWGPSRRDGPAGERNSPSNPNRPMPNRPAAALIGKVGDGADYFFIGDDTGPIRVRNGGRLYLGVNDDVLNDNRGSFRVVVYY